MIASSDSSQTAPGEPLEDVHNKKYTLHNLTCTPASMAWETCGQPMDEVWRPAPSAVALQDGAAEQSFYGITSSLAPALFPPSW